MTAGWLRFFATAALALFVAVVAIQPVRADEALADTLTIAYPIDVPSWDPLANSDPVAMSILKVVFDSALTQNPGLELAPSVVTSWRWSDDHLSLDLTLRDDVYFQNGDKLTADDLKFTYERFKTETLPVSGVFRRIKTITVKSATEAVLTMDAPFPSLPQRLAFYGSFILPRHYFESVGLEGFKAKPIGSGPYKLVRYQRDSRIVLEAFDRYWGGKPPIKNLVFEVVKDPTARVAAVESGRVDLTVGIPSREVARLAKNPALVARAVPSSDITLLMVTDNGATKDENVRLAIQYAIDKQTLSKAFFGGTARPLSLLTLPGMPDDTPGFDVGYDEAKAKELLAKSGYSPTNPVKIGFLSTNGAFPNDFDEARAMVAMLKKVGIDAKLDVIELPRYFELRTSHMLPEITLYNWYNGTGDPELFGGTIFDVTRPIAVWRGIEPGATVAKLQVELDEARRMAGYRQLNLDAAEHAWTIPILQGTSTIAYRKGLEFTPYKNGWIMPATMHR